MTSFARRALLALACLLLGHSLAFAQATRTWVSGVGDDANPCSRTAPCKTFAGAISKTADGGEIDVIDSGAFGVVTITKDLTISGESHMAGVLASGTTGIIVNGAGIVVTLRHLNVNGAGKTVNPGVTGIRMVQGASLVDRRPGDLRFQTGVSVEDGHAFVKDSLVTSNSVVGGTSTAGSLTFENTTFVALPRRQAGLNGTVRSRTTASTTTGRRRLRRHPRLGGERRPRGRQAPRRRRAGVHGRRWRSPSVVHGFVGTEVVEQGAGDRREALPLLRHHGGPPGVHASPVGRSGSAPAVPGPRRAGHHDRPSTRHGSLEYSPAWRRAVVIREHLHQFGRSRSHRRRAGAACRRR